VHGGVRELSPKASAILRRAVTIVKRGWRQGMSASKGIGLQVDPQSPEATHWCALGAINRAAGKDTLGQMEFAGECLRRATGTEFVHSWNDASGRKKSQVIAALRKAARIAEREERKW
jgi:hypothetical protein